MLVTAKDILVVAKKNKFGVVAPNVCNETTTRAAIQAAEELNAPVILDVCDWATPDMVMLGRIIEQMAIRASVPVAIQLDHGAKFSDAILAIRSGFTSIMVDRSSCPFEQNVAEVADLVRIAHSVGVSVEAELGHVGFGESYAADRDAGLTNVAEATEYVERSGCDALAVAIGTAHGIYKGVPHLDFDRLAELNAAVSVPLVLHGGSGSGDDNLVKAIAGGITKINIASDLFVAGEEVMKTDTRAAYFAFDKIADGYKDKLKYYMELFGEKGVASKF